MAAEKPPITKINPDKATREELIEFVKKQHTIYKDLEEKYAKIGTVYKKKKEENENYLKEIEELKKSKITNDNISLELENNKKRIRDLEDTQKLDAEFKKRFTKTINRNYNREGFNCVISYYKLRITKT